MNRIDCYLYSARFDSMRGITSEFQGYLSSAFPAGDMPTIHCSSSGLEVDTVKRRLEEALTSHG